MLLCIDIGNSNIKIGLFEGEQLHAHWRIATDRQRLADEYAVLISSLFASRELEMNIVSGCAISSVVPSLTETFTEFVQRYLNMEPLILTAFSDTGLLIRTDYPAEVGPDLIANALAARRLYGAPVIVVGFGTATTFSAVSAEGNFEGVAIAPGVVSSGDALFRATATLPHIALTRPQRAIGTNTTRSLQSGLVFGFAGLVESLVRRIQAELGGNAAVVATGGLANLIAPETGIIDQVEPNLALIGLRLLYERSQAKAGG